MDDANLISRLQKGDAGALEKAIRHYTPYVSAAAYRVMGASMAREDLEEVVSDVFVSLWRHAGRLDPSKGALRSWLGVTAQNAAKNKLRARAATVPLEEETPASDSPAAQAEQSDEAQRLWRAVEALGEPDATLFFRYYYEGETLRDIARALGMNLSTVKTRLARGRKLLRDRLQTGGDGL